MRTALYLLVLVWLAWLLSAAVPLFAAVEYAPWPEFGIPEVDQASETPELVRLAARIREAWPRLAEARPTSHWEYFRAMLQLKKARQAAAAPWERADPYIQECRRSLERFERGEPLALYPGRLNELAYLAYNDSSIQPFYVYLPPDWEPEETVSRPLIVFLHGYVPSTTVLDPWVLSEGECAIAGELGSILLIPYGRRNTDFQGIGEQDVLLSLAYTQSLFRVDPDRVYLTGVSMGARGVWHMAAHYPDLFAAIAPIAGHTDMVLWWGWNRRTMPGYKQWLADRDSPLALAGNLINTPSYVQHGEYDRLIATEQSRLMVEKLRELGAPVEYDELEGADHYIYWNRETYRRAWEFLVGQRRDRAPQRVRFKTYTRVYEQAHWLEVRDFARWGEPAEIEATLAEDGRQVNTASSNVTAIALPDEPDRVPRERGAARQSDWRRLADDTVGALGLRPHLGVGPVWVRGGYEPVQSWRHKRGGGAYVSALCGPIDDAFRGPFVLVRGTAGTEEEDRRLEEEVERWARQWQAFCDGVPPITTDRALTPAQMQTHNLILFGRPQTNTVIAQVQPFLPIRIGDRRYQVGERLYAGPTLGLALCYPNPLAPERYIVIFSGETWGRYLSINHKFDMLPDYIVYDTSRQEYDGCDQHLCAGFFDMRWELDETLQWRSEEE